ncbi:type II toxin-antitoxin system HipA family toxin [Ruania alkalisoli]|uniref:Type II toxin-antitoxin system HipA family toxin n=1 Tax=Ruania alkalisoli TaxID=2779775 RepID=A0A7M1SVM5_9MICO|nr:type II toxin-antitoxin system HipA family toxin [Ruania alkalisoli]QOR71598.1 type II toxin-antitoxin system HipA family toxin [Ruania alkalisoli]
MSAHLTAYLDGTRVGWFERHAAGVAFAFDDGWRRSARRLELSLSMLKSRREHRGDAPINFLWNLLPDNDAVLQRWGSRFGVSPRNPMALLTHVGLEAAGAVQLSEHDDAILSAPAGAERISEQQLAEHIRSLRADPSNWLLPGHVGGYFSLAGAQSKFALTWTGRSWAVPTGRSASTHIVKPGIYGLDQGDLNEHLTMRAASLLGLSVANSRVEQFDDERVVVVERYDRRRRADGVVRLHQEDLAQALGVHPARKYQSEGGPGLMQIVDAIRQARGRDAGSSIAAIFDATLFNWAALGTDGHAKNYSLLHDQVRGPRLAPLYDLTTALPYPSLNDRRARLAMSYGKRYKVAEIRPRHILREARAIGIDEEEAVRRARHLVSGLAEAYSQAAGEVQLDDASRAFVATLIDAAHARCRTLTAQLDEMSVP